MVSIRRSHVERSVAIGVRFSVSEHVLKFLIIENMLKLRIIILLTPNNSPITFKHSVI